MMIRIVPPRPMNLTCYSATRLVLGVILIGAGLLKGRLLTAGRAIPEPFLPIWLQCSVVVFECGFGLWMLFGFAPQKTRLVAIGCFGIFSLVSGYHAFLGEATCGCLGVVQVSPWVMLGVDLTAVILLAWLEPRSRFDGRSDRQAFLWLATTVGWAGLIWAIAIVPATTTIRLEPGTFLGRCLPILARIDVGDRIGRGDWTILFFRHNCPACRREIPLMGQRAHKWPTSRRLAFIEIPEKLAGEPILLPEGPNCLIGRVDLPGDWVVPTPTAIHLKDCIVQPQD